MIRGSAYIILKDKVLKCQEFNGGMGLDCFGKQFYEMIDSLKIENVEQEFDNIIRKFDNEHFKYNQDEMTFICDNKEKPFIDNKGVVWYDYEIITDDDILIYDLFNNNYPISDYNYIKNLSGKDIVLKLKNKYITIDNNNTIVLSYDNYVKYGQNDEVYYYEDKDTEELYNNIIEKAKESLQDLVDYLKEQDIRYCLGFDLDDTILCQILDDRVNCDFEFDLGGNCLNENL